MVVGVLPPRVFRLKIIRALHIAGDRFAAGVGDQHLARKIVVHREIPQPLRHLVVQNAVERLIRALQPRPLLFDLPVRVVLHRQLSCLWHDRVVLLHKRHKARPMGDKGQPIQLDIKNFRGNRFGAGLRVLLVTRPDARELHDSAAAENHDEAHRQREQSHQHKCAD